MAIMAADAWFVDTNVLVYANQSRSVHHANATTWLKEAEAAGTPLWISGQVPREYLSVVTRLQGDVVALPMSIALDRVR
jgi:predicted nucleic acid-binding protein